MSCILILAGPALVLVLLLAAGRLDSRADQKREETVERRLRLLEGRPLDLLTPDGDEQPLVGGGYGTLWRIKSDGFCKWPAMVAWWPLNFLAICLWAAGVPLQSFYPQRKYWS